MININHLTNHCHKSFKVFNYNFVINLDTVVMSLIAAFIIFLSSYIIVKRFEKNHKYTNGQAILELLYENIRNQKGPLAASLGATVFLWLLAMNLCDLLPFTLSNALGLANFKMVPTEDLNVSLGIAIFSLLIVVIINCYNNAKHYIKHLIQEPFGTLAMPFNILFNIFEYLTKIMTLSLRLSGNMFAGHLLTSVIFTAPTLLAIGCKLIWNTIHIPILIFQAVMFTINVLVMII